MEKSAFLVLLFCLSAICSCNTIQKEQAKGYKYIQVEAKPWVKGNQDTTWQLFNTKVISNILYYEPVVNFALNKYGSLTTGRRDSTGFFRVEKIGDRWWVIDPDGYQNIQTVINSLRPGGSERNKRVFSERFGNMSRWMEVTADSLVYYGFTGAGSWSDISSIRENNDKSSFQLSYTPNLNFMSSYGRIRGGTYQLPGNIGYPNQCIFVFDPDFETFCDTHAQQVLQYAGDKNLVGFFSDNELPLSTRNLEGYLTLKNKSDPGYIAAKEWLDQKGKSEKEITDDDRSEFAGYVAERYFRIVSSALKKYAPHHLYLGSRLHGEAKNVMPIIESAGKYCDVVSINYYGSWTPDAQLMKQWEEISGRPFMITEFYTKAMDAGLANTTGAGFTVHTQEDRGYAYQHFCLSLLESKACVGWHYFKYQDNDPTATNVDPSNIDSNKGIVNNDFEYYDRLLELMKEMHVNRYQLIEYFDN